ncbi:type II secretion system F family protein [Amycolatopsis alkalitolerans]|uniref:Type II secretion system F family protein n=1 Tax=Amycolatopsis alkalitolerans TaxID=2547244 RepID=A0A5C4M7X5_9PSEU|nr:type II secretion system F family protein [Amycolatopsis alkalitolerans]TNC29577.1 type II secretion system F family protein [Amycolatopsis alkalitolerans]
MARFAYVATAPDGTTASGVERATSREEVELALYDRDLSDIRITQKRNPLQAEILAPRVKREEVMHLSRQLGAFVRAGLPVTSAVRALRTDARNSSVRRMLTDVEDGLRAGDTLSDCLARHPRIFPEYYRGIIRSAELSGELDIVLERLAAYLERDLTARRRIRSAAIYPAVVAVMAVGTVVILAGFVMPRFRVFFDSLHAKLPLATRVLLAVTGFVGHWWWALLGGLGVLLLLGFLVTRTRAGRYGRDRLLLAIPAVGSTIRYALVERFCRLLSSMVNAGVVLPEALRVATDSLPNRVFQRSLDRARESVLEGEGLARPLAGTALFPSTAIQMIRVGEDTGTLDAQLVVTARYYEGELDHKLKKLIALFEPVVIIVMGAIVGFVAVALVSAMYGVFNQVKT